MARDYANFWYGFVLLSAFMALIPRCVYGALLVEIHRLLRWLVNRLYSPSLPTYNSVPATTALQLSSVPKGNVA